MTRDRMRCGGLYAERMSEWLSVPEFAERLGVKDSHVRELLRERQIVATRTGPNNALSLPSDFIVEIEGKPEILPTLRGTITLLADAGLDDDAITQWLLDTEEELGTSPLAALRDGKRAHVRRIAQTLV
nr:MAG: transcriptional regulator [Actinomycetota bacterium]